MANRFPVLLLAMTGLIAHLSAGAQGYRIDIYPELGQNPGGLNRDLELVAGAAAASAGWTEVYRYGQATGTGMSRGIALPPGFAFRFNGQPVRSIRAFDGWFMTFDTLQTNMTWVGNSLPTALAPNRMAWLGYLQSFSSAYPPGEQRVLVKTFGTAPHRQFWVQWNNLNRYRHPCFGMLPIHASIVLEETTNRVLMVYQRMIWSSRWDQRPPTYLQGCGLQLNSSTAWVADSLRPLVSYQNDLRPLDNFAIAFTPGARPAVDAGLAALRVSEERLSPAAGPTPIRGTVMNVGTQPLVGWRVQYRVGNGPTQTLPPATVPLAPGDTASFAFASGWNPAAAGTYRVRAGVTTAAAQPDASALNDTLTRVVEVATREVPRRVLQELATSSTCAPCAIYEDSVRSYDRRHPNQPVERIAYPMNFPGAGDPYYLPEFRGRMMLNQRNIRNIQLNPVFGTPLMIASGYCYVDATDRFTFPPVPPFDSLVTALAAPPTYVELSGTCRVGGDTVRGTITLNAARVLPARHYSVLAVITEHHTTGNASTNGKTDFYDVAKKILPTRLLQTPVVPGVPLTLPYSYAFPAGHTVEHFDSLEVVVFVQHTLRMNTSVPAEVVQVVRLRPGTVLGAPRAVPVPVALQLAPNPANGLTTAHFSLPSPQRVAVEVFDALGRRVPHVPAHALPVGRHALPLRLPGAAPGLYIVRLAVGTTIRIPRLVVE
ncbi:MAG: T9SS type A sorting domain-containing protein [Hymenobacteraceae bacterium]|nr:T9SS type A sorting domain-containing protein [Hymenobacteraceae bacterium]